MRRREFLSGAAGALAWPVATRAQPTTMPVIGFLSATLPTDPQMLPAYRQGLSVAGYTEGRNVAIEYRSADSHYDRLPALASDLVERRVDLIAAFFTPVPARAAKAATATIPI